MQSTANSADLLISAGRVLCPATGLDEPGGVAVRNGRIIASGRSALSVPAIRRLDFPNGLLVPGLVDLHGHPARGGSKFGVEPDVHFLRRGTTTVLSQGDAGAENWERYRDDVILAARTRVRLAINLSSQGESRKGPSLADTADIDIASCVRCVQQSDGLIWGIAVNISPQSCGTSDPRYVLDQALRAAGEAGCPLLFGPRRGIDDFPLAEQLPLLRPGDVMTYCFHGSTGGILDHGRVRNCVWRARERGILFDLGHGRASFDFSIAEAAIHECFYPQTISTDFHIGHVGELPTHDLPRTMSKLIAVGMPEVEVVWCATARPAATLGLLGEIGRLAPPGACADLTVLERNTRALPLVDCRGMSRSGDCWEAVQCVRGGAVA